MDSNFLNDDDLVPSAVVKREYGGISDMTIWRWSRDERVQFPPPDVVINGRKYWKRGTLRQHRARVAGVHAPLSNSK
jgi:hypothetical protein